MTTDTVPKQVALHHSLDADQNWTVGGMARGGMLAPSLATMLCVITTDAVADAVALGPPFGVLLQRHSIASMSTAVRRRMTPSCCFASGASEIQPSQADLDEAILRVCDDLCAQLQADAEGSPNVSLSALSARPSEADALIAARIIARDSLVKTALFGSDPNWGRVLAAVGMSPFPLDPDRITVSFNGSPVFVDGAGAAGHAMSTCRVRISR